MASSSISPGFTRTRTSRPACIAKDLSTPENLELLDLLQTSKPLHVGFERLAPGSGARATMASAAWTSTASRSAARRHDGAPRWRDTRSAPCRISCRAPPDPACEPSTSWSTPLPMSCNIPARRASFTFAPSSPAMMPARNATSIASQHVLAVPRAVPGGPRACPARGASRARPRRSGLRRRPLGSLLHLALRLVPCLLDARRVDAPVAISLLSASLAISRRTGLKPEITTASGVSSMIKSMPVALSSVRMLRPSRPMMRPFISSEGSFTTDTVLSATWSAAVRWMLSERMLRARRSDSLRAPHRSA